MGFSNGTLDFSSCNVRIESHTTMTASLEGAYFFTPYIGVGGRFGVGCTPMTGWEDTKMDIEVESSHLTEYTTDVGLYFSLPLNNRLAVRSKALVGGSFVDGMDINASNGSATYDYMTIEGNNSVKYGTGISLTYAHKRNSSLTAFLDYDFTKKDYTVDVENDNGKQHDMAKKNIGRFTLGAAFNITF